MQDIIQKFYMQDGMDIPFNLLMRQRDQYHYLNINPRINNQIGRVVKGEPAICFNNELFGVMCKIKTKNPKTGTVKTEFDKT